MLSIKRETLHSLLIAVLVYIFFNATKHAYSLASVNPFNEDPYDAVGSFAVQIALFLALLSCLRAINAGGTEPESLNRADLISRGNLLATSAVAFTMATDIVALARHTSIWINSSAGLLLATLTLILLAVSLYELARTWTAFRTMNAPPSHRSKIATALSVAAAILCLAIYPEHLRAGIAGALATAIFGALLLFLPLGVLAFTTLRHADKPPHDLVDEVIAVCESIKRHLPRFAPLYNALDRFQRARVLASIAKWINPRRFRWRLCMLSGATLGLLAVMMEFLSEHAPAPARAILLITIFVVIEGAGVTLAYAMFGQPLYLFRNDRTAA